MAQVQCTPTGFYKISFTDIKWYEGTFEEVDKFIEAMNELDDNDIPYSFIRIGEEVDDIECRKNWTSDIPSEIETFEPVVDVNDDEWGSYEDVDLKDIKHEERSE